MDVELDILLEAHRSFANAVKFSDSPEVYDPLLEMLSQIIGWLKEVSAGPLMLPKEFATTEMVLSGSEMLENLEMAGLGPDRISFLWSAYGNARDQENKASFSTGDTQGSISSTSINCSF